jgi:hypothetical protein
VRAAFTNTSDKRGSSAVVCGISLILDEVESSSDIAALWKNYQHKFEYAIDIGWGDIMRAVRLCDAVKP